MAYIALDGVDSQTQTSRRTLKLGLAFVGGCCLVLLSIVAISVSTSRPHIAGAAESASLFGLPNLRNRPTMRASQFPKPMQPLKGTVTRIEAKAASFAASWGSSGSGRSSVAARAFMKGVHLASRDGARVGCRGNSVCVRAVGLFFGTQTGKTEDVAGIIGEAAGLEAKDIGDMSAQDLEGFDGLIVGAPTWHTGADEERSGTAWDEYMAEIRQLNLGDKPVAVFGTGDSAGYGDNFCDAIEELHGAFKEAGAKMLGYVSADDYMHTDSKSVVDGKFLGLPLDQDNEDDKTKGRVNDWVKQLQSEGMPISPAA